MIGKPKGVDHDVSSLLATAVDRLDGQTRAGQQQMAHAVDAGLRSGVHMLIQAGTGTGKSLGYLIPALAWAVEQETTVVVATATLALQNQLINKDVPLVLDAVESQLSRRPVVEVAKGRSNYACLLRVRDQVGAEQEGLFDAATFQSRDEDEQEGVVGMGAEVVKLREWAEQQAVSDELADRDTAPAHSPRAWLQVSVSARECVGATNCRYGVECFAEQARARARLADLVITNHALLAIDALNDNTSLPEHGAVIIDEAHELTDRVTGAASAELSSQRLERVSRRAASWLTDAQLSELEDATADFAEALDVSDPGRVTRQDDPVILACAVLRRITRNLVSSVNPSGGKPDPDRSMIAAELSEINEICARMEALSDHDVIWISQRERAGRQLNIAPLSVAALLRNNVLAEHPTILTSATLQLGGNFNAAAGGVGLFSADRLADLRAVDALHEDQLDQSDADEELPQHWCAIDVGSPFDYPRQGILYIADDLPNPGKDGIQELALQRLVELISASGGNALGLFASQRSAESAAKYVRETVPDLPLYCQGDMQLAELTRRFIDEPGSCLFGTLSLWQGIDAPGQACRLVIMDKIPFPRPDDPLMQARQQRVADQGGNGFMQVAASHAALLLAQGSGRLIRRADDRGVVAILDPRLANARYGSFLLKSMPNFWRTHDLVTACAALRRLAESDDE